MYWLLGVGFWLFYLTGLNSKIKNNPVYYFLSLGSILKDKTTKTQQPATNTWTSFSS
jgi:hypothetical protein